jgi:two-component system response regulator
VEDNPDDVELTLRAFEKNKIRNDVVVARDGVEALDYLFAEGKYAGCGLVQHPQVVLLDLNLPKLNGLDVLRKMRSDERTKRIPVVILTSSNEQRDVFEGYDLGANSYIRKPVDFGQFLETAKNLGNYWLLMNEPSIDEFRPVLLVP